jgi:hypothetical protein
MRWFQSLLFASIGVVALHGCTESQKAGTELAVDTAALVVDADGDSFVSTEDCNDTDASVSPGAVEVCDGIDNNCDGQIDEGVLTVSFLDSDGDGFGDPEQPVEACGAAEGASSNANDCDDADASIFPGAAEACNGIDDDCDDEVDEGVTVTVYADADGDGFGDPDSEAQVCAAGTGQVLVAEDCDDDDPDAWPGNTEVCDEADNDCDGDVDEDVGNTYYRDDDDDGWGGFEGTVEACSMPEGYAENLGDCDDDDPAYNPAAAEDDCTDPNDYNCDGSVVYADVDRDGWAACEDCDDRDGDVNPDGLEICNGIDDDCNGLTDDADPSVDLSTASIFYVDGDGDGYGDLDSTTVACTVPSGAVANSDDCDDAARAIHPGATEVCDLIDNDCDGDIDDDDASVDTSTGTTFYTDGDGDGYGDPAATVMACTVPSGAVASDADCDDSLATISPVATEICDTIDNDCDGFVDDADTDVVGQSSWFIDGDGDGYGVATTTAAACFQPSGYVSNTSDCDDSDRGINPAATEVCDSIDNDCDGAIDDADSSVDLSTGSAFYYDGDRDGYGSSSTTMACAPSTGYSTVSSDCDDADSATYPGATEVCDGDDNDCDGSADDGATCSYQLVSSGGGTLCVDDDMYVNLNGSRIYTDTSWGAQCGHTVSFTGTPGDTLYMWAVDSVGGCRNMSTVYIKLVATGQIQYLTSGYSNTCGHGASSSAFWSRSVSVPGAF